MTVEDKKRVLYSSCAGVFPEGSPGASGDFEKFADRGVGPAPGSKARDD